MTNLDLFESIRKVDNKGQDYWIATEFGEALGYPDYKVFKDILLKALLICEKTGHKKTKHFSQLQIGYEPELRRYHLTLKLSSYACFLVAICCGTFTEEIDKALLYFRPDMTD